MKPLLTIVILVVSISGASATSTPSIHKLSLWGDLDESGKLHFYIGFTNGYVEGYVAGVPKGLKLSGGFLKCLLSDDNPDYKQAIAIIDKYYKDHPEKWDTPIGEAIVRALMVKDGPCRKYSTLTDHHD